MALKIADYKTSMHNDWHVSVDKIDETKKPMPRLYNLQKTV